MIWNFSGQKGINAFARKGHKWGFQIVTLIKTGRNCKQQENKGMLWEKFFPWRDSPFTRQIHQ